MTIKNKADWKRLQLAAENGNSEAQLEIAHYYETGISIRGKVLVHEDLKLACEWIKKAYENGNAGAGELYAYYLSNGIHCAKNTALAMKLHKDAAKKGSASAAYNLGIEFRDQHNYAKAFSYYKRADTEIAVGFCHYYGIGTPQNKLKAFRFFKRLLKKEVILSDYEANEVNYMMGIMYLEGEVVKRSLPKARHYLMLANEDGNHPSAQHILWVIGIE